MAMATVNGESDAELSINMTPLHGPVSTPASSVPLPRLISKDGSCGNCKAENISDDAVCCLFCKNSFHALCFGTKDNRKEYYPDNACTRSFLVGFNQNVTNKSKSKRFGSFVFVCDPCLTSHEQKHASDVKSHVYSLESKMNSMEADISTIKNLLVNSNNSSDSAGTADKLNSNDNNPWNDKEKVHNLLHPATVVISDTAEQKITMSELENIVTENSIEVNNAFTNKDGNTVVTVSSQAARSKLVKAITDSYPQSSLQQPKEKLPTISISGIKSEISTESLTEHIMKLYPEIKSLIDSGETFSVMSVRKQRNCSEENKLFQASVRVSNSIRKLIENRDDYLCVGLYRCKVYDHFYVKRCNKCQEFGHYKAQCKSTVKTCANCAGNHETVNCGEKSKESFKPCCANCKKSKSNNVQHDHLATDRTCPAYQSEQYKLKKSISYYAQKNL